MRNFQGTVFHNAPWVIFIFLGALVLSGCHSREKTIDVESRISNSIFLDGATAPNTRVFINTRSAVSKIDPQALKAKVLSSLVLRDFSIVSDPNSADLMIDVAVREVNFIANAKPLSREASNAKDTDQLVKNTVVGGVIGGLIGAISGDTGKGAVLGASSGLALSLISDGNSSRYAKDNSFQALTDIVVRERLDQDITETTNAASLSGVGLSRSTTFKRRKNFVRHQTKIITQASGNYTNSVDVIEALIDGIAQSVAGII